MFAAVWATLGGPGFHHLSALLEEVSASVGRLGLVADDMRERSLGNLAWKVGRFRRPVSKRRAETMYCDVPPMHWPKYHRHDHVSDRRALSLTWKDPWRVIAFLSGLEQLNSLARKRNAMRAAGIHPLTRHGPNRLVEVDLNPSGIRCLA